MGKNDEQVRKLLTVIEEKESKLGTKPRAQWKTNGVFRLPVKAGHVNINTVNDINICIGVIADLLRESHFIKEAAKLLEVGHEAYQWGGSTIEEWIHDFKLRASMLKWDAEKKKLDALKRKLKALRSEDAKTEDAISDIMKEL